MFPFWNECKAITMNLLLIQICFHNSFRRNKQIVIQCISDSPIVKKVSMSRTQTGIIETKSGELTQWRSSVLRTLSVTHLYLLINVAKAESTAQKRIFLPPARRLGAHPHRPPANEYIRLAHLQYRIVWVSVRGRCVRLCAHAHTRAVCLARA